MDWTGVGFVVLAVCIVAGMVAEHRGRASGPSVPVPRPALDDDTRRTVGDLVARDRRIEAIKHLRRATGFGLREAKEWVDAWEPGNLAAPPTSPPPSLTADSAVLAVVEKEARGVRAASGDIAAIKHVRARTGWGLADAKAYVDRL
jgi:ribosomal protein L7/L12